jgi:hypothetical protein
MAEEVYNLQVPMSAGMLALGWAAFDQVRFELEYWYADPETAILEYRRHDDWPSGGLVTTFRVRR